MKSAEAAVNLVKLSEQLKLAVTAALHPTSTRTRPKLYLDLLVPYSFYLLQIISFN